MDTPTSFGLWLRQRRRALDLTQEELARRAGCSLSAIRKIEADERRPSRQVAELLADCLEITPADRPTFLKIARSELGVGRLGDLSPAPQLSPQPERGTLAPRHNLPIPSTPLVGREHELAAIARLLHNPQCRLLTLMGPGGIGKTRLAIEAAIHHRTAFANGVYLVSLAPVSSSEFIVPTIADAIDFAFYGPAAPQAQLLNYLREKAMLLVLDNFEHLLTPPSPPPVGGMKRGAPAEVEMTTGAALLVDFLQQTPGVKLLVTSRERLNLQGEWVFEIHGLPAPPVEQAGELEAYSAAALFLQSAQRAHVGFALTAEERPAVAHLCRLVEGMPLGLELAAAWVRALSCQEIVREIEHNLDFLTVSMRDMPARHHSIRVVFDHSWKLLSVEEQRVMRQLSIFRGGFRRQAAEQVAGATLPLLSVLVDKSLLRHTETGRYDLHELVRQYAAAQLHSEPQEEIQTYNRYAGYYATLLQQWDEQLRSPKQAEIVAEMGVEIDNLRLAWVWMAAQQQMANIQKSLRSLWRFHEVRSRFQEGAALFGQAVEALKTPDEAEAERGASAERVVVLGQVLAQQGYFCAHLGQHRQARELLEKSLTLLRLRADRAGLADTLAYLGYMKYRLGEFREANQDAQESLALNRTLGNQVGIVFCLLTLSYIYLAQDEYEKAYALSSESLAICRDVSGDPHGTMDCLITLSAAASHLGRYAEARQQAEEGLKISRALNDRWGTGQLLRRLGLISLELGEAAPAEVLLRQSISQFKEIGDRPLTAVTLIDLGRATCALETYREAKQHFLEALQTGIETETLVIALTALTEIAALQMQAGATEAALELLMHVLQHPAGMPKTKDRAERLRAELESKLTPPQIEAIQARTQARPFETSVTILSSLLA